MAILEAKNIVKVYPNATRANNDISISVEKGEIHGIVVDRAKAIKDTHVLSETYGLHVDPVAKIALVPVGMRQRVEILKALYRGAEILILDEPTAVLTPRETNDLFAAIRNLVREGK